MQTIIEQLANGLNVKVEHIKDVEIDNNSRVVVFNVGCQSSPLAARVSKNGKSILKNSISKL